MKKNQTSSALRLIKEEESNVQAPFIISIDYYGPIQIIQLVIDRIIGKFDSAEINRFLIRFDETLCILQFYMNSEHKILIVLLFSLFFCGALSQSLQTLTYSFPFNGTKSALNPYYAPSYDLGVLAVNYSIQITLTVPNIAASPQLAAMVGNFITAGCGLQYIDTSTGSPVLTPAHDKTTNAPLAYVAPTGTTYTLTYAVAFAVATVTSARFVFVVKFGTATTYTKFDYYTINANYFPSNVGLTASNAQSSANILKVVDVMRSSLVKLIYVNQPNEVLTFTAFPATTVTNIALQYYTLTLTNVDKYGFNGNEIDLVTTPAVLLTSAEVTANAGAPVFVNKVAHYNNTFAAKGFYLLELTVTDTVFEDVRLTFNTDSYACPYDPNFGDHYSNFQGCTKSPVSNGLPCASYSVITGVCALCVPGYTLLNGSCYANTTCPARQYFHFGTCLDVSPTCGAFDVFTGLCLNCSDPANYYLINGTCLHKAVTCAVNQWQTNYICYNASSTCATFDPNSGKCLTCLSNLYQLNSDGTCTLIVVTCPSGQYAVGLDCVTIPVECLHFDTTLGKCLSCIKGFYVQNGVCQRIVCPNGQVPSNYGIFCVDVSPLCADYDSITGDCLSCQNSGYTVRNGACLQEGSPLAGCQERQHLGFGPCIGADLNCDTFNLVTGDCDKCIQGYYLDYTGHCAISVNCGAGQWGVNGECIGIPENCLKVDNLGLCTLCLNSNYRLEQGQCVYFHSCQSQQYLNSGGQCVDVSPNCATWNPSNGQCVTCKAAGTQPSSGVCCPSGQVYNSGQCVDAIALQNSYQSATGPSCLIRHPSLNICLKCAEGFSPDYTVPWACAQN